MPNKAIFLDLDSTLIQTKSGRTFPKDSEDWKFTPGIISKLRLFAEKNYHIVVVSNQGGIEAGYVDKDEFEDKLITITISLMDKLRTEKVYHYYCSQLRSFYRKPNPGMAYQAAIDLQIDLSKCIMVGDASGYSNSHSNSDREFARKAGFYQYYDIDEFLEEKIFIIDNEEIMHV